MRDLGHADVGVRQQRSTSPDQAFRLEGLDLGFAKALGDVCAIRAGLRNYARPPSNAFSLIPDVR